MIGFRRKGKFIPIRDEIRSANTPNSKHGILRDDSIHSRLSRAEYERLLKMNQIAQRENLPQRHMIRKAVHDEDSRKSGMSEHEVRAYHRMSDAEQWDLLFHNLRKFNGNATLVTKDKHGDFKAFDLMKLRGTEDRT